MKHLLLTGLLLGGACFTAQAQGGYQDDVYSSAPPPSAGSSGSGRSSAGQQQQRNASSNGGYNNNNGYSNGNNYDNSYGNTYADDYDYIDYQNDSYYANRFRRFNSPFHNVGYWSSFWSPWGFGGGWGPGWGGGFGYGGFGGGFGGGWGAPGFGVGVGFGGPYWSSCWGWNNWYGYGGFASYWNYPFYAGGWGGNPWLGYGQGFNNGYWNGYYAGLYGAGVGYGNGFRNNGFRNVTYGPRDGGLNSNSNGYRGQLSPSDGYRMASPASGINATTVPGITDGGRRVPVSDREVAPVSGAIANDRSSLNNTSGGRRATINTAEPNTRFDNGTTLTPSGGRFDATTAPNDRAVIVRDGNGNRITDLPARSSGSFEGSQDNRVNNSPAQAPRGGWFEDRSDNATINRQPVDRSGAVAPRRNTWSNDNNGSVSDRPSRSFDHQPPQRSFEQPRTYEQPQRSFEQPRQAPQRTYEQPQRSFEQPRQAPQRSFEQPRQAPQRTYEQPRQMEQRSFSQPRMSTPSSPGGGGFRGGGGSFGGGMRR